jgi:DNA-binding NarL/FixJ family response regulator
MSTQGLNLFIVDDNALMVTGLRNYLHNRFGKDIRIFTFPTGESALKRVDETTDIVILDYFLGEEKGTDVLKSIKKINPKTEVIMLSSNEDMGVAIDSFRKGATDYVVKGDKAWKKITHIVRDILTYPIRILVQEFKVSKFVAIFLLTFITMGIIVAATLNYMDWNVLHNK